MLLTGGVFSSTFVKNNSYGSRRKKTLKKWQRATKIGEFTKEQLKVRFNEKTPLAYLAAPDRRTIKF